MSSPIIDYRKLSIAERIQLVEDIWDSIAAEASPEVFQLSSADKAELEARLAKHRTEPNSGIPWEQVRDELLRRDD